MANLKIQLAEQNTSLCFKYSRDIATFSQEQRNIWVIKGFEQKERLKKLIGEELPDAANPEITKANAKIDKINQRLNDKQESLDNFTDTIQEISDVISILDTIIGFIVPSNITEESFRA